MKATSLKIMSRMQYKYVIKQSNGMDQTSSALVRILFAFFMSDAVHIFESKN